MSRLQEATIINEIETALHHGQDYTALVETFLRQAPTQRTHDRRVRMVSDYLTPASRCEIMQMDASL